MSTQLDRIEEELERRNRRQRILFNVLWWVAIAIAVWVFVFGLLPELLVELGI